MFHNANEALTTSDNLNPHCPITGVCIIVGTIIGAGIFVSPNSVSKRVGSPAMSILIWIGGGLLSTIGK